MNRKLITLILILILGAALGSGCTVTQSSAAGPAPATVAPLNAPTESVTASPVPPELPEPTPTSKPGPSATEEPVAYDYARWRPFESQRFGYTFLVPPDLDLMENGMDGSVNLSGPLANNERCPRITISSADSEVFRPPEGVDVVAWVAESPLTSRQVESGIEIGGLPSAHVVTQASSRVYAADDYYVIHGNRLIRIAITHCGQEDPAIYDAFLASFTFSDGEGS